MILKFELILIIIHIKKTTLNVIYLIVGTLIYRLRYHNYKL